jgi:hypothetical protein
VGLEHSVVDDERSDPAPPMPEELVRAMFPEDHAGLASVPEEPTPLSPESEARMGPSIPLGTRLQLATIAPDLIAAAKGLVPVPFGRAHMATVEERAREIDLIQSHVDNLVEGVHYGIIPGKGKKPTLLKPGAEYFAQVYGVVPRIKTSFTNDGSGARTYQVDMSMIHLATGYEVGQFVGICSTDEGRYKGPPPNHYNTCAKMAFKRALVGAMLTVGELSSFFTQDLEDIAANEMADHRPPRRKQEDRGPTPDRYTSRFGPDPAMHDSSVAPEGFNPAKRQSNQAVNEQDTESWFSNPWTYRLQSTISAWHTKYLFQIPDAWFNKLLKHGEGSAKMKADLTTNDLEAIDAALNRPEFKEAAAKQAVQRGIQ